MASFVREVLSAAGTLGDKEDLAAKMAKIRKKLLDLKSQLQTHIEARYGAFSGSLAATSLMSRQLERLKEEVQQLDITIGQHYKTELIGCNQELSELNSSLQELTLALQVLCLLSDVSGSALNLPSGARYLFGRFPIRLKLRYLQLVHSKN